MKLALMTGVALATLITAPTFAENWFPYPAEEVTPAFSSEGTANPVTYEPLEKAAEPHDICVSFPHMKDAYWLGVNYGVTEEAKRLGVKLNVVEAGGYTELAKQVSQIEDCVAGGADATGPEHLHLYDHRGPHVAVHALRHRHPSGQFRGAGQIAGRGRRGSW